jgi:tRNA A37 threonylcarbamoyladenosine dehydratase
VHDLAAAAVIVMPRFARLALCFGPEGMDVLKKSQVLVCGLGAVGSMAAEALARSGLGRLILVDGDSFEISNINRQLPALDSSLGRKKTQVMAERIRDISVGCTVQIRSEFITQYNVREILSDPVDAVIDAIDSVEAKTFLLQHALMTDAHVVSSMGAALRLDPTKILVDDISRTSVCPLARIMRQRLARLGIIQGIRCVFSVENPLNNAHQQEKSSKGERHLASFMPVTGTFGLTAAAEAMRLILGPHWPS